MGVKYFIWGAANRLKMESVGEMENSPFKDVYRRANTVFSNIVQSNKHADQGSRRDEQVANVISFLGERGRGKTSAMLSFYLSLNELQKKELQKNEQQKNEQQKNDPPNILFCDVSYIDAAMLAENEFIIDVVLAKMWDKFDAFLKEPANVVHDAKFDYLVKQVKEKFVETRQAYLVLKSKESEGQKSNIEEIPAASALHELAVSLNLKEKMADLVRSYIEALGYPAHRTEKEGYLVLAIDDVDMANVSAQAVLEQIRRFLSVPQIIILLTADFERLKIVCGAYYKKKSFEMSDEDLQKFIVDYLEKVIPSNMRIYLPELRDVREEIMIEDNQALIDKYQLESRSEKDIILESIARRCGIYFDGRRGMRSFWQNDSLRSLVNYFDQLMGLDDEKEHFTAWLRKDLQERIIERVESEEQKRFLKRLLKRDRDQINQYILEYIQRDIWGKNILTVQENSMGQVMYALDLLARINAEYTEFVNCIIVLYSLIMEDASSSEKKKMIGDSLWGEWEYGLFSSEQVTCNISGFENRAELRFEVTEDIKKYVEEQKLDQAIDVLLGNHDDEINAWLLCMLYVNIKMPQSRILTFYTDTEGEFFLSEEEKKKNPPVNPVNTSYFKLQPQLFATKSFFKFLYMNVEDQKILCRELLRCAIDSLRVKVALVMGCKASEKSYEDYIEGKIEWLEKMGMEDCVSKELLQSFEILYSIGPELGREKEASISDTEKLVERTAAVYQIVQDELQFRDAYYEKMHLDKGFALCIENSLQAKVLQGRADISEKLKEKFEERFVMLFKASLNVAKLSRSGWNLEAGIYG